MQNCRRFRTCDSSTPYSSGLVLLVKCITLVVFGFVIPRPLNVACVFALQNAQLSSFRNSSEVLDPEPKNREHRPRKHASPGAGFQGKNHVFISRKNGFHLKPKKLQTHAPSGGNGSPFSFPEHKPNALKPDPD